MASLLMKKKHLNPVPVEESKLIRETKIIYNISFDSLEN